MLLCVGLFVVCFFDFTDPCISVIRRCDLALHLFQGFGVVLFEQLHDRCPGLDTRGIEELLGNDKAVLRCQMSDLGLVGEPIIGTQPHVPHRVLLGHLASATSRKLEHDPDGVPGLHLQAAQGLPVVQHLLLLEHQPVVITCQACWVLLVDCFCLNDVLELGNRGE